MTHRQYAAWVTWLDDDLNRPNRSDCYQMQTACEVRRVLSKKPADIQPDQFRLKFEKPKPTIKSTTEQELAAAKARWFGALGVTA